MSRAMTIIDTDGHDGPICDDCGNCFNCCYCPATTTRPYGLLALAWGFVAFYVTAWALGWIGFGSGWAFLAGLVLFFVANHLDNYHWAVGLLTFVSGSFAFHMLTPGGLNPSFTAGWMTPVAAGAAVLGAWLTATSIHLWRDRRAMDAETDDEAKRGLVLIEGYLHGHDTHVAAAAEPRRIIGLSGYAGVGKDTVAAELMFNREPEYTRVSFADPIRALALAVNDDMAIKPDDFGYERFAVLDGSVVLVSMEKVLKGFDGDWTQAKRVPSVRKHLQGLGVGVRNVLGENTWVDTAMGNLPEGPIVVTDCRFPNEAQAIKDAGGYIVRVTRPGVDAANAHITDTALDDWDFDAAVYNDGTPAQARETMRKVEELLYDPDLAPANT